MHRGLYLVLVLSIWLECFIFASSGDIPVDQCFCITSAGATGIIQPAVHLIMKDYTIWLSWRGPGE